MPSGLRLWGLMTSTAIVVSDDAPALVKVAARLAKVAFLNKVQICNGTNDHIEIQAALDSLPAAGGQVFLLDGTYNVEVALVMDSLQAIRGCGLNTILATSTAIDGIITATSKNSILIADLAIDANNLAMSGVFCDTVTDSTVKNIRVIDTDEDKGALKAYGGIYLESCSDCNILDNILTGNAFAGISLGDSATGGSPSVNCVIRGNNCRLNDIGIAICCGSNRNNIIGNNCSANGLGGVEHGILLLESEYNTVVGNVCENNVNNGIRDTDGENNTITGNNCDANGSSGISAACDKTTVTGNHCYGNTGDGISTTGDYSVISGNACVGNTGNGIYSTSDYCSITGNTCNENHLFGINQLGGATGGNSVVADNIVCLNGLNGIYVLHNNVIIGNKCFANSQTTDDTWSNIYIDGDYNLVANNSCRQGAAANQPQYGINVCATADKNIIQGNDLYDAGKTANLLDVGTRTIVQDDNRDISQTQIKHMVYMQNTSGGGLVIGDVVSLKAVAAGTEFTSPAGVGEDQVWGMLTEDLANTVWGYVQTKGGTTLLKATNVGGGNIGIGDFLCTEAGNRARKAAAGDMAFAIALEVCAAANVTIDALIITPRKI